MASMERLYRWTDNRRKMAATGIAGTCMMVYAVWSRAPFEQVANAIEWILGIFITGHAVASGVNAVATPRSGVPAVEDAPRPPPIPRKP